MPAGNDIENPPCKQRSSVIPITSNRITYCFCRELLLDFVKVGTLNASETKIVASHVKKLSETWIEMVKCLGEDYLLVILAHGGMVLNELFYLKPNVKGCHEKYRKRYIKTKGIKI